MNWDEGSINDKPKMRSRKLYNILNQKEKQIIVHKYALYIYERIYIGCEFMVESLESFSTDG